MREYVVTCKTKEDLESLYDDMETPGGSLHIPDREVEVAHKRPISRNTHYMLTAEEAAEIRQDERVYAVELSAKERGIVFEPAYTILDEQITETVAEEGNNPSYTITSNRWSKTDYNADSFRNWGMIRCLNGDTFNRWGYDDWTNINNGSGNYSIRVTSSGKNVDVVIVDGHIDPDHPEFNDQEDGQGSSRVVQYNWFDDRLAVEGTSNGTYTYTPYVSGTDGNTANNNHGCHVAGTACGNRRGWARDANIYNINLYSTGPFGLSGGDKVFDYIRYWHNNKPVNPATGVKNPTIVNNSWGTNEGTVSYANITSVTFRGVTYDVANEPNQAWTPTRLAEFGILTSGTSTTTLPVIDSAMQADLDDCFADGIIMVGAAGNSAWKVDVQGGIDYDNKFVAFNNEYYYHRGSQPSSLLNTLCVGAASRLVDERKATFSMCGPRIDVWAPGEAIISSVHNGVVSAGGGNYTTISQIANDVRDTSYQIVKYQGTSMAAPQVTGSLACLLELWPRMSPTEAYEYIKTYGGKAGQIADPGSETKTYGVTNSSSDHYVFSGDATGNDPTISVPEGTVLTFNISVGSGNHPFWIKTTQTTGSGNGVTTGNISGNGQYGSGAQSTGTVTWDTRGVTPGTYYYICESHGQMSGEIVITSDATNNTSLQGAPNWYLYHEQPRKLPTDVGITYYGNEGSNQQMPVPRGNHKYRKTDVQGQLFPRRNILFKPT